VPYEPNGKEKEFQTDDQDSEFAKTRETEIDEQGQGDVWVW